MKVSNDILPDLRVSGGFARSDSDDVFPASPAGGSSAESHSAGQVRLDALAPATEQGIRGFKNKSFMPYDIYERHRKVASYIKAGDSILDVGGELNQLSQFTSARKIIVANLTSGNVIITRGKLPFGNKEFSVVCAIDVLEHIPKGKRRNFLNELLRVAQKEVILSFPIGTQRHIKYEEEIQDWLIQRKLNVDYLKEHLKFGLPTVDQIKNLTKNLKAQFYFSGNLYINKFLFKLHIFDPNIRVLRKAIYLLKLLIYFLTNPVLYILISRRNFSRDVVRVYIVIDKK